MGLWFMQSLRSLESIVGMRSFAKKFVQFLSISLFPPSPVLLLYDDKI